MRLPSVSVVVPTYRRAAVLRGCLEALAAQDYPVSNCEIIVVDDGGDFNPAVVAGLPGPPVRLVPQPHRGPASARNTGARLGTGELLAFTDDDCRPRPDWLTRMAEAHEAHPGALVGGAVVNALTANPFAQASQDLVSFLLDYFPRARALRPFFTSNNMACHRDRFLAVGGFDDTFPLSAAEDRDFSERWSGMGGQMHFAPAAVVDHCHGLNGWRFLRQHFRYGRGAAHLGRRRRIRGGGVPLPEPLGFYWEMLTFPVRHHGRAQGLPLAALIATAQVAGVIGMLAESARGLLRLPAPPLPDQESRQAEPDGPLR